MRSKDGIRNSEQSWRAILERLREVRIMVNVRMQEASEYKHAKEERSKARLWLTTLQVKIATDKELDYFMQYLKQEYDQIHKKSCKKNQPEISMEDYVLAAEALLYSRRAQLQILRAEAGSR